METIIFKVPDGMKAQLRKINPNLSALLRNQAEKIVAGENAFVSAHDKANHLIFPTGSGRKNLSTSNDYLKQYAKKHR